MADAPDSTPKAKTQICRFFKSKKGCKYGNECQFLHPEKASNDIENIPQDGGKMIDNKPDTVIKTSPTAKTCRFFKSTKGCKFGNECKFLHREKPTDKLESIPAEVGKLDGNHKQGDELKVSLKLSATPNNETVGKEKRIEPGKDSSDRQGIVCKFFKKKKGCLRGSRCPFAHVISGDGATLKPLAKEVLRKASKATSRKQIPRQGKENTKPVSDTEHVTKQIELVNLQVENDSKKHDKEHDRQASGPGIQLLPNKDESAKGTGMGFMDCNLECKRLRSIEIQQLKRRFGGQGDCCEIQQNTSYKIKFKPTDPDWSFNIEAVYFTVSFPEDYPLHIFDAYLSEEQGFAEDIIKFANKKIQQWALNQEKISNDQGLLKLFFRPFLRWFDRNLESVFIDGGKEMRSKYVSSITSCSIIVPDLATDQRQVNEHVEDNGCESCPSSKQIDNEVVERNQNNEPSESCRTFEKETGKQVQSFSNDIEHESCNFKDTHIDTPQTSTSDTIDQNMSEINNLKQVDCMEGMSSTLSKQDTNSKLGALSEDTAESNQSEPLCNDSVVLNTVRKGTEIQFRGLNLEENVSTLRGSRVVFTLECNRCRQRIDQQLSVSGPVSKQCTRCASVFAVNYRPAIIHQFSSVVGYLDLDGCMPFDVVLPESELMFGCLNCSKETTVKGLQYGANRSWCSHCHAKLGFQIQSTRFQELQLSETATVSLRKSKDSNIISKPKKQIRSSVIKEGQPLPANGTCKHYKKSFRWLRFPCCGKCYPCDLCHEEQEDHEMKYATRMVCGFCSREQPYTQQPCNGCKAAVTKSRSAHWEGGKGCRDKVTMSRNDEQKHKQSGKTVSRKAQKRSEGKGKGKGSKGK